MSAVLHHEQIDLATGKCLGSSDTSGWADQLAHVYSQPLGSDAAHSDSDFTLSDDSVESEDSVLLSNDSYVPASSGKKRLAAKHPAAKGPAAKCLSPSSHSKSQSDSLDWMLTFQQFASDLKLLESACHKTTSLSSDMLKGLKVGCTSMIQFLRKIPRSTWSTSQWKSRLRASGFISAFFSLQYIHIDPSFHIPDILLPLWRQCQLFDTISFLLYIWFKDELALHSPSSTLLNEELSDLPGSGSSSDEGDHFYPSSDAKSLVEILLRYPTLIPLRTNPSFIFFLSSDKNFAEAYDEWLRVALGLHGVKARVCLF
jgi:hypothetical protein